MTTKSILEANNGDIFLALNHLSATIDGVAAIVYELVSSSDLTTSRMAFACHDVLSRASDDLSELAMLAPRRKLTGATP